MFVCAYSQSEPVYRHRLVVPSNLQAVSLPHRIRLLDDISQHGTCNQLGEAVRHSGQVELVFGREAEGNNTVLTCMPVNRRREHVCDIQHSHGFFCNIGACLHACVVFADIEKSYLALLTPDLVVAAASGALWIYPLHRHIGNDDDRA